MRIKRLKINSEVIYLGIRYIVVSIDPPNVFIKRVDTDGVSIRVDFSELVSNGSLSNENSPEYINFTTDSYNKSFEALEDDKKNIVYKRMDIIKPLIVLKTIKEGNVRAIYEFREHYSDLTDKDEDLSRLNQEELINRISKKNNISVRTIKRYLAAYKKAENIKEKSGVEGLVPRSGSGY